MIVMDLKLDNFCAFKGFHVNFSYPKKIVNSSIADEYLKDRPNFRYKRVNILMGANATGKTSLGMMLMTIFNFICRQDLKGVFGRINQKDKAAYFSIDFIPECGNMLYRVEAAFPAITQENKDMEGLDVRIFSAEIGKNDSYETCAEKLREDPEASKRNTVVERLAAIPAGGWLFTYPRDVSAAENGSGMGNDARFLVVLENLLRTLDPSIRSVEKSSEVDDSYIIKFEDKDLFVQNGEVIRENILSSGTKAGIDIAEILAAIILHKNGFYYCDEKFSYIDSDVEQAVLSVMIGSLDQKEQLFFTSHNKELLDMDLPKHAFARLKKKQGEKGMMIEWVDVSDFLKRNTDSLRRADENDLFSAAPDLELIYDIPKLMEQSQG